jgi:acetylornithine deacetylase/succinyl-diaminopimelate desuccinylase-like protein
MASDLQIRVPGDRISLAPELARITSSAEYKAAIRWFRDREPQLVSWQTEVAAIPAPPYGETSRSAWFEARFTDLGLSGVYRDEAGNVFGIRPGLGTQYISVSAHIDTVFPLGTPLRIGQEGTRLAGPGISDNGAGLTAMLAMASVLMECKVPHNLPILFIANVGEEGEGDLRGMREVFSSERWRDAIAYSLILDGAGNDTIVAEALGSRRFEVTVRGPGGHSWSDFGAPNPIVTLSRAIGEFTATPLPATPKTTLNVGVIRGGTSVNSIPQTASMRVDIRSTSREEIDRVERALCVSIEHAVEAANRAEGSSQQAVEFEVEKIGDRPAGELSPRARILRVIREVDQFLGNTSQIQRASTDANIPLSMGREAIALGGGGSGGGAHTLQEWFDCKGRELGLKRILLTLLALANPAE